MSHPDASAPPDRRPIEAGEVWENPVTRERAVVLELPWQNGEGHGVAELTALPGARVMGEHLHPALDERFSVLQGELTMVRDGRRSVLRAGESAHIEPGVWHDWWNEAEADAIVRVEVTPGERFVHMIETLFGLAREGHVNAKGMPSPLQLARPAPEFSAVIVFPNPPRAMQRIGSARWRRSPHDAATAPPTRASRAQRWRRGQRTPRPADHPGPAAAPDGSEQRPEPRCSRSAAAPLGGCRTTPGEAAGPLLRVVPKSAISSVASTRSSRGRPGRRLGRGLPRARCAFSQTALCDSLRAKATAGGSQGSALRTG